jgi:hypothetical protein
LNHSTSGWGEPEKLHSSLNSEPATTSQSWKSLRNCGQPGSGGASEVTRQ